MSAALNRRLSKVEEISARGEIGTEVDRSLEKMGTSRAAMLADFGSLSAFRDWLVTDRPEWRGDPDIYAKWDAIFERHEALQTAGPGA